MKKTLLTAVAAASLMAFGCDDKKEMKAPTDAAQKTADNAADKAADALNAAQKDAKGGAAEIQKANPMDEGKKAAAESLRGQIADLMGKAKQNLDEKKFDEAQKFVDQAKTLVSQLPADMQSMASASITEAEKHIADGKAAMMPK